MFPALLPKSAPFFAMLNEQNDLLRRMSALLVNMLEDVSNMDHVHKEIAFLEEEADLLHSKIIRALSQKSLQLGKASLLRKINIVYVGKVIKIHKFIIYFNIWIIGFFRNLSYKLCIDSNCLKIL